MESEAVQGATKTPKNLRETLVKAVSEVQRQNRKIFEDVAKNYPEATVGHSVMSAYRGAESSSQYENSFDTFIEAPIQTLRAIASRFALEHSQESTVVQIAPSKEYPANGVNVAYDFPAGTKADDIEAAMQKAGLSDYRVIS